MARNTKVLPVSISNDLAARAEGHNRSGLVQTGIRLMRTQGVAEVVLSCLKRRLSKAAKQEVPVKVAISVPPEIAEFLTQTAAVTGLSINQIVNIALEEALADR